MLLNRTSSFAIGMRTHSYCRCTHRIHIAPVAVVHLAFMCFLDSRWVRRRLIPCWLCCAGFGPAVTPWACAAFAVLRVASAAPGGPPWGAVPVGFGVSLRARRPGSELATSVMSARHVPHRWVGGCLIPGVADWRSRWRGACRGVCRRLGFAATWWRWTVFNVGRGCFGSDLGWFVFGLWRLAGRRAAAGAGARFGWPLGLFCWWATARFAFWLRGFRRICVPARVFCLFCFRFCLALERARGVGFENEIYDFN